VLINNAGDLFGTRGVTGDWLERTFATNHMAECARYPRAARVCAA
jgi:hypothetical protein